VTVPHDPYLNPACRPWTLDSFGNRRLILRAVREALPGFRGLVLDVGAGEQPYKSLVLSPPSRATEYVALDLPGNPYRRPDLEWDGATIPKPDASVDTVLLTEVLEHCSDPARVLNEVSRVLRPGGSLFLTVPFIWPIHSLPQDEFRYTPFALRRLLEQAGFDGIVIGATGGRHAVLAVTLGLWIRRRPLTSRIQLLTKPVLSWLLWPVISGLFRLDRRPDEFLESTLIVGLTATASKPVRDSQRA
jgi:SAM-dependent methyltransferase